MNIRQFWKNQQSRINARTLRERVLIFSTTLVIFYFIFSSLVFIPLEEAQQQRIGDLAVKSEAFSVQQQQIQQLIQKKQSDPDAANQHRLAELEQQLKEDEVLGQLSSNLVSPVEMARLVEKILEDNNKLEIRSVENLQPILLNEVLQQNAASDGATESAQANVNIEDQLFVYKHGMEIEVAGSYKNIVGFLKALEALPWKVLWGEIRLVAEKYPKSTITLVLYTLSMEEAWIGV